MPIKDVNERIKDMLKDIETHRSLNNPITNGFVQQPKQDTKLPENVPLYSDLVKDKKTKS